MGSLESDREERRANYIKLREDMRRIQADIADISVTAHSPGGLISATVVERGRLQTLDLDPRIYRTPDVKALSEAIVETVLEATEMAQRRVFEITRDYLAPDAKFENTDVHAGAFMHQLDNRIEGANR